MPECSFTNPGESFNFKLNPAIKLNQAIASLCNKSPIEMAEVNRKGFENTVYITTTTEVAELHFLKLSWLINVHGRIPMASLDHISQILVDPITMFHVDGSTDLFFIFGGHGKSYTALIPTTSCSFTYSAVKKHADADKGTGNSPNQNANNANSNNDAVNPSNTASVNLEYGESSGDNGGGDGNKNDNAGNDRSKVEQHHRIRIHRIDVNIDGTINFKPIINTNLRASQFNSWQAFGRAIHRVWVEATRSSHAKTPPIREMNQFSCWPGATTSFGYYQNGNFIHCYWEKDQWKDVKTLIADVRVVRFLSPQHEDEDVINYNAYNANNSQPNDDDGNDDGNDDRHEDGGNNGGNFTEIVSRVIQFVGFIYTLAMIVGLVVLVGILIEYLVKQVIDSIFRNK